MHYKEHVLINSYSSYMGVWAHDTIPEVLTAAGGAFWLQSDFGSMRDQYIACKSYSSCYHRSFHHSLTISIILFDGYIFVVI